MIKNKLTQKDKVLTVLVIIIFLASLIQNSYIPILAFTIGFFFAHINNKEHWVTIKK